MIYNALWNIRVTNIAFTFNLSTTRIRLNRILKFISSSQKITLRFYYYHNRLTLFREIIAVY